MERGGAVTVRVHDACVTSEVFGSLRCDCREQLHHAFKYTREHGGIVIYLQQEGRGIGLSQKLAAYSLQQKEGLDTVDANLALGLPDELRQYFPVKAILDDLGVRKIRLMTNNPYKISWLRRLGVHVTDRVPILTTPTEHNQAYLQCKRDKMGHYLDLEGFAAFLNLSS